MPAVSVVIPLYNKGPYIARALNSVLAQTFQDFEVIVVDDGSTDDGAAVVRGFDDPRIRLIQQENQGVSAARNRGVEAAQAELVAFLDADDEWMAGHLETLIRLREKYPEAGLYATTYFFCTTSGELREIELTAIPTSPWEGVLSSYFLVAAMSHNMPISSSSVGIPKDLFSEIGCFSVGLNMYEDSELWGKIALRYPIVFSWQGGSIYHLGGANRLCNRIIDYEHPFIKIAEYKIREKQISSEILDDLKEYIAKLKITFAIQNILLGKNKLAKDILVDCDTKLFICKKYLLLAICLLPRTVFLNIWKTKRRLSDSILGTKYYQDPWEIIFE